ncbi:MAG: hydroxymethylglutaryl-CoA reductase [Verrucomicrobia bacterium]|nr:hydroxymethylglutaryl-CoA reductase [Verrucomicrobiota bacterium]MBS0637451.1 hydroxymethylglutaryl-CoA reductase [Verrucomicrobiota bacterium]
MTQNFANIPLEWVGPIQLIGPEVNDLVEVPLATFESPLWPSTTRGATLCNKAGGIRVAVLDERMTRSVLVQTATTLEAQIIYNSLFQRKAEIASIAEKTSSHISFTDMHIQVVGNLIYVRLEMRTDDASGHNMVTKASDAVLDWICKTYPEASYVSISGNFCTDKKVSAVNGILGRGKYVVADVTIPRKLIEKFLKTTPEAIVQLNIKKNLIGSIIAGSLRSANAHFANMLLALYLATGQDAANIVEGSQGIVHAEMQGDSLYFSVTLPNIIMGTVGAGKNLDFVQENLTRLGCKNSPNNARRLACIMAATCLSGELSLLGAQTNPGELVGTHMRLERAGKPL